MHNPINPSHYTSGAIECIEAIEASLTAEAFRGFLKGNVIKYLWRYERKKGSEDLLKAQWYLNRLIDIRLQEEASARQAREIAPSSSSTRQGPPETLALVG